MSREQYIQRFAKLFFWENILKTEFSQMNIEFIEIVLIEELIPFSLYSGFSRIKSLTEKNEFIEITVTFNKRGIPSMSCSPTILNSIDDCLDGGKILLDNR
jgi:hypothetical protein